MDGRRSKHIPIACRYVPYDQWFLTHADPTWKIKHLKQSILAKALSLPFDPRGLTRESAGRAPSPITFAPEEAAGARKRGGNESVAGAEKEEKVGGEEGYEEDDEEEWEDAAEDLDVTPTATMGGRVLAPPPPSLPTAHVPPLGRLKPLLKLGTSSSTPSTGPSSSVAQTPIHPHSSHANLQQAQKDHDNQILTAAFTLIRFSTGQILEEDFVVSWYDLCAHELVEMHCSAPLGGFVVSVLLGPLLTNGGEMTREQVGLLGSGLGGTSAVASGVTAERVLGLLNLNSAVKAKDHKDKDRDKDKPTDTLVTLAPPPYNTSTRLYMVALPRHLPSAYVQPYWEGWVRCLRVVWRPEVDARTAAYYGYDYDKSSKYTMGHDYGGAAGGMGAAMGVLVGDIGVFDKPGHDRHRDHSRDRPGHDYRRDGHGYDRRRSQKTKLEWRERWVVIRDGVVRLCKDRDESLRASYSIFLSFCL
ncbi:hypothetical protein NLJ89_g10875 [Agrocybe chaxingu]|uniref:Uncharacterized protein n=1 Tax=Agrocybe chaxingu TaxID=84603 RepID=A0A9W8JXC3_9AGAR|nr:hypothetical protein NLJ89_g10875 [Agrocybe chaxingu]